MPKRWVLIIPRRREIGSTVLSCKPPVSLTATPRRCANNAKYHVQEISIVLRRPQGENQGRRHPILSSAGRTTRRGQSTDESPRSKATQPPHLDQSAGG